MLLRTGCCTVIAMMILMGAQYCLAASLPIGLEFYNQAHRLTQAPPPANTLRTICATQVDQYYIALLKTGQPGVFVGVFSPKPIEKVEQYITLRLQFASGNAKRSPEPFEWLYLFDRSGAGRFDYLAWPVGPGAIKPEGFEKLSASRQQELLLKGIQFVFEHAIDENTDGNVDALVLLNYDPVNNGWIDKRAVVRSSKYDGVTDQAWYFLQDISAPLAYPDPLGKGYKIFRMGGVPKEISGETLNAWTNILGWFNEAAKAPCDILTAK